MSSFFVHKKFVNCVRSRIKNSVSVFRSCDKYENRATYLHINYTLTTLHIGHYLQLHINYINYTFNFYALVICTSLQMFTFLPLAPMALKNITRIPPICFYIWPHSVYAILDFNDCSIFHVWHCRFQPQALT